MVEIRDTAEPAAWHRTAPKTKTSFAQKPGEAALGNSYLKKSRMDLIITHTLKPSRLAQFTVLRLTTLLGTKYSVGANL